MAYRRATATRNSVADTEGDLLNGGSTQFRTGSVPTNVDDAAQGTLLGTTTYSATAFGAPSNGVVTAAAITSDTSADASGTAGHARNLKSDSSIHSDATCGQGSGDYNFDNAVIVAGGTIAVGSLSLTAAV